MSKEQRKSMLTAIAAFACLIVVITYVFPDTFSWLGSNLDTTSNQMNIQIQDDTTADILEYKVYRYRIEDGRVYSVVDDPTETNYMVMNQYDMVFTERNQYTPLIVKMTVRKTGELFDTTVSCTGDLYNNEGRIINNLSNVVRIRCGMNSAFDTLTESTSQSEIDEFYTTALAFFRNDSKKVSVSENIVDGKFSEDVFVNYSLEYGNQKKNEMSFTLSSSSVQSSLDTVNIYLFIDYKPELMVQFVDDTFSTYHSSGVDVGFINGETYSFIKDLDKIKFSDNTL